MGGQVNSALPGAIGFIQTAGELLNFHPHLHLLITQEIVDNLLSWRHSGFSVHANVCVTDRVAAARLGRYMIRCPVVLERLSLDEDTGEILYCTRPSRADHPEGPVARWDVFELIARVLDHLPRPRQQMVQKSPSASAPDSPGPP